ncbi:uncharacterized protein LOC116413561 isoform X1 [Galleria mellonella]|uniref:Uncharacterized protein LOC116413561 isoform X1 n=1 Tax=Galleria mellonella TaxID=7137 RepID=A0ABM3MCF5_GALME|nr:uncharacterized protein LOC116413561 isoform X1 [Galleria mellonella]
MALYLLLCALAVSHTTAYVPWNNGNFHLDDYSNHEMESIPSLPLSHPGEEKDLKANPGLIYPNVNVRPPSQIWPHDLGNVYQNDFRDPSTNYLPPSAMPVVPQLPVVLRPKVSPMPQSPRNIYGNDYYNKYRSLPKIMHI